MRASFRKLTDAIRGVILYQLNHQRDNFMEEQERSPAQNDKNMHGALKKRISSCGCRNVRFRTLRRSVRRLFRPRNSYVSFLYTCGSRGFQKHQIFRMACKRHNTPLQNQTQSRSGAGFHYIFRFYDNGQRYGSYHIPSSRLFRPEHVRRT